MLAHMEDAQVVPLAYFRVFFSIRLRRKWSAEKIGIHIFGFVLRHPLILTGGADRGAEGQERAATISS